MQNACGLKIHRCVAKFVMLDDPDSWSLANTAPNEFIDSSIPLDSLSLDSICQHSFKATLLKILLTTNFSLFIHPITVSAPQCSSPQMRFLKAYNGKMKELEKRKNATCRMELQLQASYHLHVLITSKPQTKAHTH
jgi:hypothetical protein